MSWMTFWKATEADVLAFVSNVKKGGAVLEADLVKVEVWVNANAPSIVSDIQAVLGVVGGLAGAGVPLSPAVTASVAAAHKAIAALDAYVAKSKAGGTTVASVLAGYTALKEAAGAHADAAVAITNAPAVAPSMVVKK